MKSSRQKTLLVLNTHTNEVEMVKGIDQDGNLQKVLPQEKKDNDPLIRVDKHGDHSPTSFPIFTDSLKIPRISTFSKFQNTMHLIPPKIFKNMSIRHLLKKKKS